MYLSQISNYWESLIFFRNIFFSFILQEQAL